MFALSLLLLALQRPKRARLLLLLAKLLRTFFPLQENSHNNSLHDNLHRTLAKRLLPIIYHGMLQSYLMYVRVTTTIRTSSELAGPLGTFRLFPHACTQSSKKATPSQGYKSLLYVPTASLACCPNQKVNMILSSPNEKS